jgi:hypothetical protein
VAAGVFVILIALVLVSSLVRPHMPSYAPSELTDRSAGAGLVVDTVTLDARDADRWVFFDFERGNAVDGPGGTTWDIAVQRYHLIVNGGEAFEGVGGALSLPTAWRDVREAPASGYVETRGGPRDAPSNPALEHWYRYSFFAHTLAPRPEVYALRTADGRYAKLRILSYYCPGATPGCMTFEYAYQGDGSRSFLP